STRSAGEPVFRDLLGRCRHGGCVLSPYSRRAARSLRRRITLSEGANIVRGLILPLLAVSLVGVGQLLANHELPPSRAGLGPVGTLRGVVQDVNLPRNQFLLRAHGGEHLFVMAPRCKVKDGVAVRDRRDLKVGDEVSVLYEMKGGMKMAHSVLVHNGDTP